MSGWVPIAIWGARTVGPKALAAGGACGGLVCAALCLIAVGWVLRVLLGWRRGSPAARDRALRDLGLDEAKTMPDGAIQRTWVGDGVVVVHREDAAGQTWTGSLRSYAPGQVHITERPPDEGWPPPHIEGAFLSGDPDLDQRFRFISPRKADLLEALGTGPVHDALMACAVVDVQVQGDEIVFRDPGHRNLAARWGRAVRLDRLATGRAIRAQVRVHREVEAVIAALARAIRSMSRL